MAKRKFLLAIGQSNSTAIGDAQSWEDQNIQIALRSPTVAASQQSEGSYFDSLTLPYTFSGGRQSGQLGQSQKTRPWQTVNTRGLALQSVQMLTFYDPSAAQTDVLSGTNRKYPGTAQIAAGSTPDRIRFSVSWRYSPSGLTLTRRRDGQQYTVTYFNSVTNELTIAPQMFPPPVTGEEFTIPLVGGAAGTASTVLLNNGFGGVADAGTFGTEVQGRSTTRVDIGTVPSNLAVQLLGQPVQQYDILKFNHASALAGAVAAASQVTTSSGSATISVGTDLVGQGLLRVGDYVRFEAFGNLNSQLTTQGRYYVSFAQSVGGVTSNIRVSDGPGQTDIVMSPGGSLEFVFGSLPNGIDATNEYTVQSVVEQESTATTTGLLSGIPGFQFAAAHPFRVGQQVRVATSTGPFLAGVDYWVHPQSTTTTLCLSSTPGPSYGPSYTLVAVPTSIPTVAVQITTVNTIGTVIVNRPAAATISAATHASHTFTLTNQPLFGNTPTTRSIVTLSAGPGGSVPTGLSFAGPYEVEVVSATNGTQVVRLLNPSTGALVTWANNATAPLVLTQVGGDASLFVNTPPGRLGVQRLPKFRGSLTGLTITCTSGVNAGLTRPCGDVYLDNNVKSVIELGQPFPNATTLGATYTIQPPALAGTQIPFSKYAMWLPWSPFEGEATQALPAPCVITAAGPGQPYLFTFVADILSEGTEIQFFGEGGTQGATSTASAGSTASVIQCASISGTFSGSYVRFRTGALAGQARAINLNTATSITLFEAFPQAPATNDAFDIVFDSVPPSVGQYRSYFVKNVSIQGGLPFYTFSATYKGPEVVAPNQWNPTLAAGPLVCIVNQNKKTNPYPPGFNYPNHYTPVAGAYQPFQGPSLILQPKQSHYVGLGLRIHESIGEPVYVVPLAVTGSGLAQKESSALSGSGQAWFDPDQQTSWAPGDANNCFGRLLDVLDAAKMAFQAQGDTGECIGIVWVQGEEDATDASRASRYYRNCTAFKAAVRAAIRDRGLASMSASKIPWIAAKVRPNVLWVYADTINAAIDRMVEEDPYSRAVETSDLPVMLDGIHYTGAGMNTLGQRIYEQWLSVQRMGSSEVDICNLALANIGETAKITSIDPPDGSAQASLCARFYPIARDSLIEMGSWSFAIKRKALTATTNTRTEWAYAYTVPADVSGILSLTMEGVLDDLAINGVWSPQKFVIELLPSGDRILYTNVEDAQIRYIAKITDTTLFTNTFNVALSWHLASMLAGPLIKGDVGAAEAKRCAQMATAWMMRAATHDTTTQAEIKPMHTPSWIGNR